MNPGSDPSGRRSGSLRAAFGAFSKFKAEIAVIPHRLPDGIDSAISSVWGGFISLWRYGVALPEGCAKQELQNEIVRLEHYLMSRVLASPQQLLTAVAQEVASHAGIGRRLIAGSVQQTITVTGSRGSAHGCRIRAVPSDVFDESTYQRVSFNRYQLDVLKTAESRLTPSVRDNRLSDGSTFIRSLPRCGGLSSDKTARIVNSKQPSRASALFPSADSGTQGRMFAADPAWP